MHVTHTHTESVQSNARYSHPHRETVRAFGFPYYSCYLPLNDRTASFPDFLSSSHYPLMNWRLKQPRNTVWRGIRIWITDTWLFYPPTAVPSPTKGSLHSSQSHTWYILYIPVLYLDNRRVIICPMLITKWVLLWLIGFWQHPKIIRTHYKVYIYCVFYN